MKPQQRQKSAANRRKLSPGVGLISYASGRVAYRYRWTDGTGKRQVATFDSPEEAESFRLHILSDPQADTVSQTMTFASWWDRWMEPRDLLPSTRKGYESLARNHILPALGDLRLCDIRASHLIRMHADMLQTKGLSDSHSGKALEQVGACLQDAVIEGSTDPTLAVVGIVPAHAYDHDYGSDPIGSGRYRLEQWDKGQQVILTANPDYYGPAPKVGRVVVLFMSEDASLAAAAAGQVDVAYTSATLAGQVPAGFSLFSARTVDSRGISLPSIPAGSTKEDYPAGNDVTSDPALRRAMNTAVDRDRMVEHVLNGHGTAAFSVGDALPWASPDMKLSTDVEGARQVLADGGWTTGADGIVAKDGVRAAFDLYYSSSDSVRQALAADFADQMRQIGIEVSPRGASWDDIYPHQYNSPVLWGWGSNSPVELYQLTHSSGWGNYACYDNAEIDAHLDRARAELTVQDSYEPYRKAQWDEAAQTGVAPQGASTWVWLANIDHLYFQRDGITIAQQKPHPHGHGWSLVNNVDQWDV